MGGSLISVSDRVRRAQGILGNGTSQCQSPEEVAVLVGSETKLSVAATEWAIGRLMGGEAGCRSPSRPVTRGEVFQFYSLV